MIPRTVVAGCTTLLACVAFALAVQHETHGSAVPLVYLGLLLVALMLLDRALRLGRWRDLGGITTPVGTECPSTGPSF